MEFCQSSRSYLTGTFLDREAWSLALIENSGMFKCVEMQWFECATFSFQTQSWDQQPAPCQLISWRPWSTWPCGGSSSSWRLCGILTWKVKIVIKWKLVQDSEFEIWFQMTFSWFRKWLWPTCKSGKPCSHSWQRLSPCLGSRRSCRSSTSQSSSWLCFNRAFQCCIWNCRKSMNLRILWPQRMHAAQSVHYIVRDLWLRCVLLISVKLITSSPCCWVTHVLRLVWRRDT